MPIQGIRATSFGEDRQTQGKSVPLWSIAGGLGGAAVGGALGRFVFADTELKADIFVPKLIDQQLADVSNFVETLEKHTLGKEFKPSDSQKAMLNQFGLTLSEKPTTEEVQAATKTLTIEKAKLTGQEADLKSIFDEPKAKLESLLKVECEGDAKTTKLSMENFDEWLKNEDNQKLLKELSLEDAKAGDLKDKVEAALKRIDAEKQAIINSAEFASDVKAEEKTLLEALQTFKAKAEETVKGTFDKFVEDIKGKSSEDLKKVKDLPENKTFAESVDGIISIIRRSAMKKWGWIVGATGMAIGGTYAYLSKPDQK